ncbi:cysteine desulfurase-like protein [Gordonia sp. TBRC 11910]|uniref:Cysteine desulfurase-like protein n=1 Tax=Gordonia asplenii TaxID=2725283 RepID=A0A848KS28_9ACTN|nr:cysteine desulfurase-like protein [Gordonia asplenii]NMO01764.1 cysteine desulfurase-like protein [Gordonia asplenii]
MTFDVAHARGLFPSLGDGWIHLDPQAGMQIPDAVASAVSTGFRSLVSAPGGVYPGSTATRDVVIAARRAVADLVAADPAGVVLGPSVASLIGNLADSYGTQRWWGTEVLLSKLDDEANIVPWLRHAAALGARVRWAEMDIETGQLATEQFGDLITDATKVVAVTLASSTTGALTDISEIAGLAHKAGAKLIVDASSAAPYLPMDIRELGADVMVVSADRWGGPRVASMVFADPSEIDTLESLSIDPTASGPARLEVGQHQGALLAGLVASVEHLASLDEDAIGKRRRRLVTSLDGLYEYLQRLMFYLINSLENLTPIRVLGKSESRIPVVSFTVDGVSGDKVVHRLTDNGVCALTAVPSRALDQAGVGEADGAVTIGLAPYSTPYEVDHLVRTLASLA